MVAEFREGKLKIKGKKEKCMFTYYDSIHTLETTNPTVGWNKSKLEKEYNQEKGRYKWWGLHGSDVHYPHIKELSVNGWPEGRKKAIEDFAEKIKLPHMPSIVRTRRWRDQGDEFDIQRVYAGQIDKSWQVAVRDRQGGLKTHVLISVDIGGNCGRKPDEFFWRGALAAILADKLILSGRSVKIVLGQTGYGWSVDGKAPGYMETNMLLKDFHQPMTLDSMICATALCGWFRSFGFKMILNLPYKCTSGLGCHIDYEGQGIPDNHPNLFRINVNEVWSKQEAEAKAQEIATLLEE